MEGRESREGVGFLSCLFGLVLLAADCETNDDDDERFGGPDALVWNEPCCCWIKKERGKGRERRVEEIDRAAKTSNS